MGKCVIFANFSVIVDSLDITLTINENAIICSKWLKKYFFKFFTKDNFITRINW